MNRSIVALGLSSLFASAACGGAPGSVPPPVETPPAPAPAPVAIAPAEAEPATPDPAPDPEAVAQCEARGKAARDADDPEGALAAYRAGCDGDDGTCCERMAQLEPDELIPQPERIELHAKACELGDVGGCLNGGQRLQKKDPARASKYLVKGCGMLMDKDRRDTTALSFMCGLPLKIMHQDRAYAAARPLAEVICREDFVMGCTTLGAMLANGDGGPRDLDRAEEVTKRACDADPEGAACENLPKIAAMRGGKPASDTASEGDALTVENANLTMNNLSADGVTLHAVACRMSGSGVGALFAGPVLAGALAKKKAVLSRCGKKGTRVRARWQAKGGRITNVETADKTPTSTCVKKVLQTTVAPFPATCAADIEIP
jgi:hypothetical protein